ncbi:F-box protein At3g07870-like [Momordica charantia]|uniref:F-box protein At3g07870-like n=1 Tax=Momordica charantia TaxID=3673 RepID=A0A6J1BS93_MOMCH|nr:F-box protein At3g07870-like [Momordica charantia]
MVSLDSCRRFSWIQLVGIRGNRLKKRKSETRNWKRKIKTRKILEELFPLTVPLPVPSDANKINWDELSLPPLPPDVIQLIFSKLPFFNLPGCRLVCKAWNNFILTCKLHSSISTSNLFYAHISPFNKLCCVDLDPKHLGVVSSLGSFSFHPDLFSTHFISIINSCNGLLCCSFKPKRTWGSRPVICILNPMTNEYLIIPISGRDIDYRYGLGFSPKTKQYKLVRNSEVPDKSNSKFSTLVEILAFGTSSSPEWSLLALCLLKLMIIAVTSMEASIGLQMMERMACTVWI